MLRWQSAFTDDTGMIGPTSRACAEALATNLGRLFPDINYSVERSP